MIDDQNWETTDLPTFNLQRICDEMGLDGPQYESVREMVRQALYAADFGFDHCEIEKRQTWHVAAKFHQLPEYRVRPAVGMEWSFVLCLCGPDDVSLMGEGNAEWYFPEATSKSLWDAVEAAYRDPF